MVHNLITSVKITYKNGETRVHALLETPRDFIIAHGYNQTHGIWDNGIYMPKHDKFTEVQALKNFVADIETVATHEWVESVRF